MTNKLLEDYIQALDSPNYNNPYWIEAFIYFFKQPENVPLNIWLKKLDDDVDYFEKVSNFEKVYFGSAQDRNMYLLNKNSGMKSVVDLITLGLMFSGLF